MLNQERLKTLLSYDPETGLFIVNATDPVITTWVFRRRFVHYRRFKIGEKLYSAHRLAWLYVYGVWPKNQIDHLDGDGLNNKIVNLRSVFQSVNLKNSAIAKNNTSGVTGVSWNKQYGCWRSAVNVDLKRVDLGGFKKFEDAVKVRKEAEKLHGYHPNHGRPRVCAEISVKTEKKKPKKAIVRISSVGVASIEDNGDLKKGQVYRLNKWKDTNNIKALIKIMPESFSCKIGTCEICEEFFFKATERNTTCSDRCRTRKCRRKKALA